MPVRVNDEITIPDAELRWRFSRSSGPGGQGVNTTDSRVELVFDLRASEAIPPPLRDRALSRLSDRMSSGGSLVVAASEHRSQLRNREAAAERLAAMLREALAPPPKRRRATKPSKGAQRRRLESKKRRSQTKRLRRDTSD